LSFYGFYAIIYISNTGIFVINTICVVWFFSARSRKSSSARLFIQNPSSAYSVEITRPFTAYCVPKACGYENNIVRSGGFPSQTYTFWFRTVSQETFRNCKCVAGRFLTYSSAKSAVFWISF
jgi:hypothetical protein